MALKAAFIFIAPNADPAIHRSVVETEQVTLISVGVSSYEAAVEAALKLIGRRGGRLRALWWVWKPGDGNDQ